MPSQLIPLTIQAPGYKGLNSQMSSTSLDSGWATELENVVFDLNGRISSRKGISNLTTSGSPGNITLEVMQCWESFDPSFGSATGIVMAGNNKIYKGAVTVADCTGTITAPTANNWQFLNYRNDRVIGVQHNHTPIVATIATNTLGNFADVVATSGTVPKGDCGVAAFGRVWISDTDRLTIKYCALLNEAKWAAADGAGSIDTTLYWANGRDYIVAISAWENKLVVFGKNNILIYSYPGTPAAIELSDSIEGTGCIARDSIQHVGSDILFLSASGVRSLKKTLVTQNTPVQELTLSVRDSLMSYITSANENSIKSCYNELEGIYLLLIRGSSASTTFCVDIKNLIQNTSPFQDIPIRISKWTGFPIQSFAYGHSRRMFLAYLDGTDAKIGEYAGYYDGGTNSYTMKYSSPWIDLANPNGGESGTFFKILKQANITTVGSSDYQVNFGVAFDFATTGFTKTINVVTAGVVLSEWNGDSPGVNLTEWGLAEFNAGNSIMKTSKVQLGRFGQHLRLSVSIPVEGYQISLQKIDLFMKKGRITN